MLRTLSIRDFVIVDRLDLEFQDGFTVLTGETGAGKSILIDALALVLGERSDPGLVREGCGRAEIGAEFSLEHAARGAGLARSRRPGRRDRRVRAAPGAGSERALARLRQRPARYAAQLKELGEVLIDIHGQHEHQSLLRPAAQRELLDAYAGVTALSGEVGASLAGMAGGPPPARGVREQRTSPGRRARAAAVAGAGAVAAGILGRRSGTRCSPITAA